MVFWAAAGLSAVAFWLLNCPIPETTFEAKRAPTKPHSLLLRLIQTISCYSLIGGSPHIFDNFLKLLFMPQ